MVGENMAENRETLTFAEQLGPIRKSLTAGRPEVKPVVQVTCQLAGATVDIAVQAARTVILDWLRNQQGVRSIPDRAWTGEPFEVDATQDRPVAVEASDAIWAMRYDNPNEQVPGRIFRTEAIIGWTEKEALLGVRLSVISREWNIPFFRTVPRIVSELADRPGLTDYGFPLSTRPWQLRNEDDIGRLVVLLENEHRSRPVFVVSLDGQGTSPIDAEWLAIRTAGLAHVVTIPSDLSWALSEEVGDRLSVYGGALRTYNPGFDRLTSRFEQHQIATRHWIRQRFATDRDFLGILVARAIDSSVTRSDLEDRLPSFARVRDAVAARRLAQAKRSSASDAEIIKLYEQENTTLREDRDQALDLASATDKDLQEARRELERVEGRLFQYQQRVTQLESVMAARLQTEDVEIPDNLSDVDGWVAKFFAGKVHLLPRAIRGARRSTYFDIPLVYQCLQLLAGEYRDMRLGNVEKSTLEERCRDLKIEINSTGDRARLMQWPEDYEVVWGNGVRFLDMHVKKGTTHDPSRSLRIYFFWDPDEEQIVIGHLTDHLTNDFT